MLLQQRLAVANYPIVSQKSILWFKSELFWRKKRYVDLVHLIGQSEYAVRLEFLCQ